ncbi:hypothetical protein [Nonomuraea fuscirosea]|uniref:hypothetical protein n=1 Tax=Nonomuraea fuscirosea TaxID=1291556 RepID=UPI00342BBF77
MTAQHILNSLIVALKGAGFVVHKSDDCFTPSGFPGDAIVYIRDGEVEMYLIEGSLQNDRKTEMACDRAAAAIAAAGLYAGDGAAAALVNGRVLVTAV